MKGTVVVALPVEDWRFLAFPGRHRRDVSCRRFKMEASGRASTCCSAAPPGPSSNLDSRPSARAPTGVGCKRRPTYPCSLGPWAGRTGSAGSDRTPASAPRRRRSSTRRGCRCTRRGSPAHRGCTTRADRTRNSRYLPPRCTHSPRCSWGAHLRGNWRAMGSCTAPGRELPAAPLSHLYRPQIRPRLAPAHRQRHCRAGRHRRGGRRWWRHVPGPPHPRDHRPPPPGAREATSGSSHFAWQWNERRPRD
jgi:hypothetical protein